MGEVWRGVHRLQGVPVAVKVLTRSHAADPEIRRSFRNEVQAVAGLDHPGIILLFDHGEVDAQAARASAGRLREGSPYLVMELCSAGSLEDQRVQSWRELKRTLLALLDALAHAHARGVIHRDLKPANVLMGSDLPERAGLKLTDFGLAHALLQERAGSTEGAMGTPYYMAPEQIHGRWRDYGPWTDLYAVGCIAWELATGQPPFQGHNFWATAMLHLGAPLPRLEARLALPLGFDGWLARLLAKPWRDRFALAADAAWALERLGDPFEVEVDLARSAGTTGRWWVQPRISGSTPTVPDAGEFPEDARMSLALADTQGPSTLPLETAPLLQLAAPLPPLERPPWVETWRREHAPRATHHLLNVGLALYGLRASPLVGREAERTLLWDMLGEVNRAQTPRAVLLHGPAGCGKSRLARFLCERAHEVGAAETLVAPAHADGHRQGTLARMAAAHLGCLGLERAETLARVREWHQGQQTDPDSARGPEEADPYEVEALVELLHPTPHDQPGARVRFTSPEERYVVLLRLLQRAAQRRPLLVWIEDAASDADTLGLVEALGRRRPSSPILVLMTARDEALATRGLEAEQLSQLGAWLQRIALGPLPDREHGALVRELLGLEGELLRKIEERTQGNPLFAVELVGDWVRRGLLSPGPAGFVLAEGAQLALPDGLHQVWAARLADLLASLPPGAEDALELTAALGAVFLEEDWRDAQQQLKQEPRFDVLEALRAQGLAKPEPAERLWSFSQNIVRESVARTSQARGRWGALHTACAWMLVRRSADPRRDLAARIGQHMLEAGQAAAALAPLERAVRDWIETSHYRDAARPLALYRRALSDLRAPPSDPRRGKALVLQAWLDAHLGRLAQAVAAAEEARDQAHAFGWAEVLPDALLRLAHARRLAGETDEAARLYPKALTLYAQRGDARGQANCLRALAQMRSAHATREERTERFRRALELFQGLDDSLGVADCLRGLGQLAQEEGARDRAAALTAQAMGLFERLGNQLGVGLCLNGLGEMARAVGDLDKAERGYRRALGLYEALGSANALLPRLNLALVLLARGRHAESRGLFLDALEEATRMGRRGFVGAIRANLLPCAAALGLWDEWDAHLEHAEQVLQELKVHDADIAWTAELGAGLALAANETARGARALRLALAQRRALGDAESARALQARVEALEVREGGLGEGGEG
jgi:serine/threonine protein kinase/tetratricopeptide (TPR) repeat protein